MTMPHDLEAGVFGKAHPVLVEGTVSLANGDVYTRPGAAEYGSWQTLSLLGTETDVRQLIRRDEYRSRAVIYVNAPGANTLQGTPYTATSPTAGQLLSAFVIPVGGEYTINWGFNLSGTPGAADTNNVQLLLNGVVIARSVNAGVAGTYAQTEVIGAPANSFLTVNTIGAGTAGAIYTGGVSLQAPGGAVYVGTRGQLSVPGSPQGGKLFSGTYEVKSQQEMYVIPDGFNPVTITVLSERYDVYPDMPVIDPRTDG